MARMVATKAALSVRIDALTDADGKSEQSADLLGQEHRVKLESRLRALVHQSEMNGVQAFSTPGRKQQKFEMTGGTTTYNAAADAVGLVSTQREPVERALQAVKDVKEEKRKAKEERRAKRRAEKEKNDAKGLEDVSMTVDDISLSHSAATNGDAGQNSIKEKKRKLQDVDNDQIQVRSLSVYKKYCDSMLRFNTF